MQGVFLSIPKPWKRALHATFRGVALLKTFFAARNDLNNKGYASPIAGPLIAIIVAIAPCLAGAENSTVYQNTRLGIEFVVPHGYDLYTPEDPGPLAAELSPGRSPFIIVNPGFREENINVVVDEGLTEADLLEYLSQLKRIQNLPIPGYERVSVQLISIGKTNNIRAVEHVFYMHGNIPGRTRQVSFNYKGRGITFTFATAVNRFDEGNTRLLSPILGSLMLLE